MANPSTGAESQQATTQVQSVLDLLERVPESRPALVDLVPGVQRVARALVGLDSRLRSAVSIEIDVVTRDAEILARALLESGPRIADDLVATLMRRFIESGELVIASATTSQVPEMREHDAKLQEVADAYGSDAKNERRAARANRVAASLALVAGLALSASVATNLWATGRNGWTGAAGLLITGTGLLVTGLVLLASARGHERSAREYTRLQRGLSAVGPYLAPLPGPARHLLRATMAQGLFPQLLEDDDPLRQPKWPDATEILSAAQDDSSWAHGYQSTTEDAVEAKLACDETATTPRPATITSHEAPEGDRAH